MKTLLINSAKIAKNSITAHTRSIIELSKQLDIELVSTSEEIQQLNPKHYKKIAVFGSAFYPKTAEIEAWIRKCDNPVIIWINNEYQCSPNSEYARLIKDYESIVISNVAKNKVKGHNDFHLLNLNTLLVNEPNSIILKKYDLLYYGTYRPNRRLYLQKYFNDTDFYLSSTKKNLRKFYQLAGCNATFCNKLNWTKDKETLNLFKYSLYIEDEFTHGNYNHLANRFYECLFCNVVQFFDKSCSNTIQTADIEFDDYYYVDSYEELKDKVENTDFDRALQQQQEMWLNNALQEKKQVLEQLKYILT